MLQTLQQQQVLNQQIVQHPESEQENSPKKPEEPQKEQQKQEEEVERIPPSQFQYSLSPFQAEVNQTEYLYQHSHHNKHHEKSNNASIHSTTLPTDDIHQLNNREIIKKQVVKNHGEGETEVYLIRHGTSVFNLISEQFAAQTGFTFKDREAYFNFDKKLLDTELHQKGKDQAHTLGYQMSYVKFHTVFVSPLKRTLQTCYEVFKHHPDRKDIKFIVLPSVSEIYSKVCDIADYDSTFEDKELSEFFDFSQVQQEWQINNISDQELHDELKGRLEYNNPDENKCSNLVQVMMEFVDKKFPKNVESYTSVWNRAQKTKEFIRNYIKENKIQSNNKVAIISHNGYLRNFTAVAPDDGKSGIGGRKFANCEVVSYKY